MIFSLLMLHVFNLLNKPRTSNAALILLCTSRMNPVFTVDGIEVVLHPLEIVSVAIEQLGVKIGSLEEDGNLVTAALDELLTQAWK